MPKIATYIPITNIHLDRTSAAPPLQRQLYDVLRHRILIGTLKAGMRLPSTRAFAKELGVSRNTVSNAFSQLLTEGYVESLVGSGTHVTRDLPDKILYVNTSESPTPPIQRAQEHQPVQLSDRGQAIADIPHDWEHARPVAFNSSLPAIDSFPFKEWERLLVASWQELQTSHLGYYSAQGYQPLREALVDYLATARGVQCTADQILITNGAQQAVTLIANLLLNPQDPVWVENPCYPGIRAALSGVLADTIPVPVDDEGMDVTAGLELAPQARLAYVSPSHQYPLGVTMSLSRRIQLIQWAQENSAWIVEDDYDSEYRYSGYPVPAVQGLDKTGRVIYVGTFSKVLFPALRLGYLVLPPPLVRPFHAARAHIDRGASLLEQATLARFIRNGHLARHVRRMRIQYAHRQAHMVQLIEKHLGDKIEMRSTEAGLHCVLWLPEYVADTAVSARLADVGITAPALSTFALKPLDRGGLVLGYAVMAPDQLAPQVELLCHIVDDVITSAAADGGIAHYNI